MQCKIYELAGERQCSARAPNRSSMEVNRTIKQIFAIVYYRNVASISPNCLLLLYTDYISKRTKEIPTFIFN